MAAPEKSTKSSTPDTKKKAIQTKPSLVETADGEWGAAAHTKLGSAALTYLMRQALDELEPHPQKEGEARTVAQGFVADTIKNARAGNSKAMDIVFERMEGKVPSTAINVNATFTDDERVARVLGLIKRGTDQAGLELPVGNGEGGA